ncbi:MAG: pro-sigmaK processing inhibitor BofA family protein [Clostridia bacterium]|nr:pro-sigmaK processing inhibitor BofA family protein [Clostridia bacterium]
MEYLIFAGAILGVLVILKLLAWPIKKILKVVLNVVIGIVLLYLFNMFGASVLGFIIPINWITALIVGVLGIPGFICLLIYFMIFN